MLMRYRTPILPDVSVAPPLQPIPRRQSRFSMTADDSEAIYSRYESPTSPYSPVFHEQRESPALSSNSTLTGLPEVDEKHDDTLDDGAPTSPPLTGVRVRYDSRSPALAGAASFPPSASVATQLTYGASSHGSIRPPSSIYEDDRAGEKLTGAANAADHSWLLRDGNSRFGYTINKHKRKIIWGIVGAGTSACPYD